MPFIFRSLSTSVCVVVCVYVCVRVCVRVRACVRVCVCCRVLALLFSFVVFFFFRQMYICHKIIIHLCLLMAKSMFSADFANKLFDVASEVLIGSFY